MKFKHLLSISILLLVLPTGKLLAAPIISQYAAGLSSSSYSSSGQYLAFSAEDGFNGGIWNSGDYGWQWLQADMGTTQTLTELKLTIAQSPIGPTTHQVYLADSSIGNNYSSLTPIFQNTGTYPHGTILDFVFDQDYSGQFLQIVIHAGPSWTAVGDSNTATTWQQTAPSSSGSNGIPEPSILALLALGIIGIGLFRRNT